jgi:Caspase domain
VPDQIVANPTAPGPPDGPSDRALVVGIQRYPDLGLNPLQGPVKDAEEMADWLANSAKAHVTLITSNGSDGQKWTVTDIRPHPQDIIGEFENYLREANKKPVRRLGRRLYIYMAGHGFMPEPRHLALITANAIGDQAIPNIQATSWVDWFADQFYFDELVLWMDCCATRTFSYDGGRPLLKKVAERQNGRGKVVIGVAAGATLEAFEGNVGPNNEVRGLFTNRLLRGLRGEAAHSDGIVRTSGLKSYLTNKNILVGGAVVSTDGNEKLLKPQFLEEDELEFANVAGNLPLYKLKAPLADGTVLEIRDGQQFVGAGNVQGGEVDFRLAIGLYKAVAGQFSRLFEISSGSTREINLG